jgi:hypothetical protein
VLAKPKVLFTVFEQLIRRFSKAVLKNASSNCEWATARIDFDEQIAYLTNALAAPYNRTKYASATMGLLGTAL